MAIEIREINIKTEVTTLAIIQNEAEAEKDLKLLRDQLLDECKKLISIKTRRKEYKR